MRPARSRAGDAARTPLRSTHSCPPWVVTSRRPPGAGAIAVGPPGIGATRSSVKRAGTVAAAGADEQASTAQTTETGDTVSVRRPDGLPMVSPSLAAQRTTLLRERW